MSYSIPDSGGPLSERIREGLARRAAGIVAALALEALLLLLLLTLSQSKEQPPTALGTVVAAFDARPEQEEAPEPPRDDRQEPKAAPAPVPQQAEPVPAQPAAPLPPPVRIPRNAPKSFDLARLPQAAAPPAPSPPAYGPPDTGFPGDSERVGTAPNGEPLYAAEWYRRPDKRMLGDYLSTAQGPGYGLIACRTVPEFRVEDCVALDEYPERSNIARAVLAAAWEFRVRPPRIRGRYLYGEWVRIRIDYEINRGAGFVPPN